MCCLASVLAPCASIRPGKPITATSAIGISGFITPVPTVRSFGCVVNVVDRGSTSGPPTVPGQLCADTPDRGRNNLQSLLTVSARRGTARCMDFALDDDQRMIVDTVRRFADRDLRAWS